MEESEWRYKDINTLLKERAERLGNKVYIESPDQGKNITFDQTYRICNQIANFLKGRGIKATDRIALIGENSMETLLIYFGVLNYGANINPINVEESKENIYQLLNLSKPKTVFHGQELTFNQRKYQADLWVPYSYYDTGSTERQDFFSTLKQYSDEFESPVGNKDAVGIVVFTSGTTAIPKGVLSTRESLFYMAAEVIDRLKVTERDVILEYRAYNWLSAQTLSILTSLIAGATLVYGRRFSRSRFPSWLKDYGITICAGVPTVLNMLLEQEVRLHKNDVPSLRFMTCSSAPLPVKTQLRFEEKYGIPINQGAGTSETDWMALNNPEKRRLGSIGQSLRFKEVLILDEQGNELPNGQEGEVVIKGKAMGLGYITPEGGIDRFPKAGFHTGDLGYKDSDGYIYIIGRKKDIIIRGGVNISPMEITSCLMEHPAVQEAATIGVPNKIRGEEVASFIVIKEGEQVSPAAIIEHCKKKLPDFKLPKTIDFVTEFPKGPTGKVTKTGLLKIWEERHGEARR